MAQMISLRIIFVMLIATCIFQVITAFFDFHKYFESQLFKVIKDENLNCTNYIDFCEKSLEQFQNSVDATETNANEMATELCKVVLKEYLCVARSENATIS